MSILDIFIMIMKNIYISIFCALSLTPSIVDAQIPFESNPGSNHGNRFEQLGTMLASPNMYRSASGAAGPKYWQQRADYDIDATLDEKNLMIIGKETVTYYNQSPDALTYLWLQLDENEHDVNSESNYYDGSKINPSMSSDDVERFNTKNYLKDFGDKITKVTDALGKALPYTINQTMMRIDLPTPLVSGQKITFKIDWNYKMTNRMKQGGRGGYEFFPKDGNHIFTVTQWYPRLCVYSDFQGWQNHQFTGRGEFALAFGNFNVKMTVPSDHVVMATGECTNYPLILSPGQLQNWTKAQTAKEPVEIVTLAEAKAAELKKATSTKTWIFKASNVRDFAWGSSRKFIWDAMPATVEGKKIMCMSGYPKEAYGLYRKYSTKAVAHTIKTYSKFTIPYPYPVAQSIEAANGMEYPMICFNFGRTEEDGTYSEGTKYGMLGVIFHEVGHNFFPMIVNSDERQWSWFDEGLNTFCQFLTEQEWDNNYPSDRGPASAIADYMSLPKDELEPIMTNSENIIRFGPNAYSKPATALNILRETVMGRKLFDYSFKEYAKRWAFKHPTPSDFFRTMEDASAVDLDWFWRGWFYGIEPVDISLDTVKIYKAKAMDTLVGRKFERPIPIEKDPLHLSQIRNKEEGLKFVVDVDTNMRDFYNHYVPTVPDTFKMNAVDNMEKLNDSVKAVIANKYFYELTFSNKGGNVMPIILRWNYKDGTNEIERINAYIWRKNEKKVIKAFMKEKEVASIELDPLDETGDINTKNNKWNIKVAPSKIDIFKQKRSVRGQSSGKNPMQKAGLGKKS
jgi:Peptidase family M1 domain